MAKISGFKNPGFKRYLSCNKKHRAVDQDHALSAVRARAGSAAPKSCVGLRRVVRGLLREHHQPWSGFATGHISSYIAVGAHPTGSPAPCSFLASHPSLKNGKTGRKSLPVSAPSHAHGRACQKPVCFVSMRRTVRKKRKNDENCTISPFANGLWHKIPWPCGTAAPARLGWAFTGGVPGALAPDTLCKGVILFKKVD